MQLRLSFLCLLGLGASHAAKVEEAVTPVQKVVQLLMGMLEKGKKEKKEEVIAFASKTQFCADNTLDKKSAIKDEKQTISMLTATIESQTAKIDKLARHIAANQKDADTWSGDIKAALKVRDIEKADFDKLNKDYSESISALGRAISTLKAQSADTTQAASSLIQVSHLQKLSLIPDSAKKALDAFVQQGQTEQELFAAPPEANGYEFQSSGVVDMLSKLEDKFIQERTTSQKEEANTKRAHDLMLQDLRSQIAEADKDVKDHTKDKMRSAQARAGSKSDRDEETKLLAADTKFLKDLTTDCSMAKAEFEAGQKCRGDEIVAIEQAVSIISSGSVAGSATKHLPTLLQKSKAPSLGQLRASSETQILGSVAQFLHAQAAKFNSKVLEAVALRAAVDPMKKVKNMIKDLITKLMEEANAEADHKGFCDTELATNKATRTEKTDEVESLNAEIDQLQAEMSKAASQMATLSKQVTALDAAMAKSTEMRTKDKATNKSTVVDAQAAQAAVAQALTVLQEFYQKAGDAAASSASFLQAPYAGMGAENGGVTSMLEVIMSDFARLEAETKAQEATDQTKYEEFMTDSKVDKAGKNSAIKAKLEKKQDSEGTLNTKQNDLQGTQTELNAALNVFEKLKPSCVSSGTSYDDRVARRKEEIESMKEALQVLQNNGEVN